MDDDHWLNIVGGAPRALGTDQLNHWMNHAMVEVNHRVEQVLSLKERCCQVELAEQGQQEIIQVSVSARREVVDDLTQVAQAYVAEKDRCIVEEIKYCVDDKLWLQAWANVHKLEQTSYLLESQTYNLIKSKINNYHVVAALCLGKTNHGFETIHLEPNVPHGHIKVETYHEAPGSAYVRFAADVEGSLGEVLAAQNEANCRAIAMPKIKFQKVAPGRSAAHMYTQVRLNILTHVVDADIICETEKYYNIQQGVVVEYLEQRKDEIVPPFEPTGWTTIRITGHICMVWIPTGPNKCLAVQTMHIKYPVTLPKWVIDKINNKVALDIVEDFKNGIKFVRSKDISPNPWQEAMELDEVGMYGFIGKCEDRFASLYGTDHGFNAMNLPPPEFLEENLTGPQNVDGLHEEGRGGKVRRLAKLYTFSLIISITFSQQNSFQKNIV